jgi:hypothetical protein
LPYQSIILRAKTGMHTFEVLRVNIKILKDFGHER